MTSFWIGADECLRANDSLCPLIVFVLGHTADGQAHLMLGLAFLQLANGVLEFQLFSLELR